MEKNGQQWEKKEKMEKNGDNGKKKWNKWKEWKKWDLMGKNLEVNFEKMNSSEQNEKIRYPTLESSLYKWVTLP